MRPSEQCCVPRKNPKHVQFHAKYFDQKIQMFPWNLFHYNILKTCKFEYKIWSPRASTLDHELLKIFFFHQPKINAIIKLCPHYLISLYTNLQHYWLGLRTIGIWNSQFGIDLRYRYSVLEQQASLNFTTALKICLWKPTFHQMKWTILLYFILFDFPCKF